MIAALVLRMTSDPAEDRGQHNPATRPGRRPAARRRSQARPIRPVARRIAHTHAPARSKAAPGTGSGISSNLAYAAAPYDNRPALAQEAQRQRDGANHADEAQLSEAAAFARAVRTQRRRT
jgi:hypothetical protein